MLMCFVRSLEPAGIEKLAIFIGATEVLASLEVESNINCGVLYGHPMFSFQNIAKTVC